MDSHGQSRLTKVAGFRVGAYALWEIQVFQTSSAIEHRTSTIIPLADSDQKTMNEHFHERGVRRIPLLLSIATLLLAGFSVAASYFRIAWSDGILQFDFAVVNIVTIGVGLLLAIVWSIWLFFWSDWSVFWSRFVPFVVFVTVVGGIACFRPLFKGGMVPDRWEPRWWASHTIATNIENRSVPFTDVDPAAFPQYLGPNRNGRIDNFTIDVARIIDSERMWKRSIGAGWSGIVAANDVAFTMQQNGEFETVQCFEIESGLVCWEYRHQRRHDDDLGGIGPRATPTMDGDNLYAQGANGLLVCLKAADGSLIWQKDLSKLLSILLDEGKTTRGEAFQTEKFNVVWGRSGSPLIVDDMVVVPGGGPDGETNVSLIAFDKLTGDERWRGGDSPIGYSSPVLMTLDGVRQIVTVNESIVAGYQPDNGNELWRFDQPGHSDSDANTSQPVQVGANQVLTSKGYGLGGKLIEVNDDNGKWTTKQIWASQRVLKTKLTSAVIHDAFAYSISDGILECVELATGERIWKAGRYGHGQILLVGDTLLVHSEDSFLTAVPATPDGHSELGRIETVSGVCWNTICLYKNFVIIRSDVEAACFRLPERTESTNPADKANDDLDVKSGNEPDLKPEPDPAVEK